MDDYLVDLLFDEIEKPDETFVIDSLDKANWAAGKLSKAENSIQQREALAEKYIQKIELWLQKANIDDLKTVDRMTTHLEPFIIEELRERKEKHIHLFQVTASLRKLPDKTQIIDEAKALKYCEKHIPEAVKVKKSLLKSKIKDPNSVPGVERIKGVDKLYIEVTSEQEAIEAK